MAEVVPIGSYRHPMAHDTCFFQGGDTQDYHSSRQKPKTHQNIDTLDDDRKSYDDTVRSNNAIVALQIQRYQSILLKF